MRLSEAIREGAKLRPQVYGDTFGRLEWPLGPICTGSDAFGAAFEATHPGLSSWQVLMVRVWPEIEEIWPEIHTVLTDCPECDKGRTLGMMIAHLNDDHRWTREAIADWVETVEPKEAARNGLLQRT